MTERNKINKYIDKYKINGKELEILFILKGFKEEKIVSQKEISKMTKRPKTTINYQFKRLREKNLVNKKNNLTERGIEAIQYFIQRDKSFSKKLRAHKIQMSITIQKLHKFFFQSKNKILQPFTNGKYKGLKGMLKGVNMCFYSSNKLVLKIPDVLANSDSEIVCAIEGVVSQIYEVIETEFKGIKLGGYEICKFSSMHCAILNSVVAESFLLEKKHNYSNGTFCIDGSKGVPELEAENVKTVFDDINYLSKYEDVVKENQELKKQLKWGKN